MPALTLASFNTHYGLLPFRQRFGPYDLAAALKTLDDPDVMVIQEVWRPDGERGVVDEFADEHGYTHHHVELARAAMGRRWPRPHPEGDGSIGLAVLSRVPGSVVDRPAVGPTPGDGVPVRRVLHVRLDLDGAPLDLVGAHLTSRLPHGPPIQLRRLAQVLPDDGRAAVLAGDLNFWGPTASLLLPGWQRTVRGRTWPATRPHSQIDHVFVRGPVEVHGTAVLPPVGSDHRPVRVRLRIR